MWSFSCSLKWDFKYLFYTKFFPLKLPWIIEKWTMALLCLFLVVRPSISEPNHFSLKHSNYIYLTEVTTGYWGCIYKNAYSFIAFILWKGKIKEKRSIRFCSSVTELPIVYRTVIIRQHSRFVFTSVQPSHLPDTLCRLWILLFYFVGLLFFSH